MPDYPVKHQTVTAADTDYTARYLDYTARYLIDLLQITDPPGKSTLTELKLS